MLKRTLTIGIDEVGRGPIAGPVAVGAFVFLDSSARRLFKGVKESKQLSEAQREAWFAKITAARAGGAVDFRVTFQSEKGIDRRGLTYAIRRALERSIAGLRTVSGDALDPARCRVLLDGGLKAPAEYAHQKTIIKGDEKEMVIALASICAKVMRDRRMNALGRRHARYGFERHKGYGTAAHYEAIRRHGMLPIHRRSFLKGRSGLVARRFSA